MKKLKTVDDRVEPGVRLADAIAGVCCAYYDNPQGKAKELFSLVQNKITAQLVGGQAD